MHGIEVWCPQCQKMKMSQHKELKIETCQENYSILIYCKDHDETYLARIDW